MKPITKSLSKGSFSPQVYDLQKGLDRLGYEKFKFPNLLVGYFGDVTRNAVIAFQKENGIQPALGNVGQLTRVAFNHALFKNEDIFHATVLAYVGLDASPNDRADDENGCMDTMNCLSYEAFGYEIGGVVRTAEGIKALVAKKDRYREVYKAEPLCIVISHTVGNNVGHIGWVGTDGVKIYSNSSATGKLTQNYTVPNWQAHYTAKKGLTTRYFKIK